MIVLYENEIDNELIFLVYFLYFLFLFFSFFKQVLFSSDCTLKILILIFYLSGEWYVRIFLCSWIDIFQIDGSLML